MGFGTFIRSNLLPVSLAFASFALIAFVLATTGVGWPVIVLVCGIGAVVHSRRSWRPSWLGASSTAIWRE